MVITDEAFNLSLVKNYLRVDSNEDDTLLQLMIDSAKSYIQSYLNQPFESYVDIPVEFTLAALNLVAQWFENRAVGSEKATHEYLYNFTGLLDIHRKWLPETSVTA
ncbi:head-tail connector protein [Rummeliibacillus pycnus]|uniref:head-tail connector protein n=1 Tax=Rummeliibacillus pycnus TaxID=101070 RepID=UPI000C9CD0E4|nr:head-tail connector protein [Rummeliibacillus pycnus]